MRRGLLQSRETHAGCCVNQQCPSSIGADLVLSVQAAITAAEHTTLAMGAATPAVTTTHVSPQPGDSATVSDPLVTHWSAKRRTAWQPCYGDGDCLHAPSPGF